MVAAVASAQPPQRPPVFSPDDREGLVRSPNQAVRHAWKRPVHWKSSLTEVAERGIPPATPAERAAGTRALAALSAVLQATPEGTSGQGFWVNDVRRILGQAVYEVPRGVPLARWPLRLEAGYFPFYHEDIERNGTWRLSVSGETESATFAINRLPGTVGQPVIATEDRGRDAEPTAIYLRPRETGRFGGLVIYEDAILVAARPGRDPWAPVPVGRALTAVLPRLQDDVRSAERRLDGLRTASAEVQAPAWEQQQWAEFEKNNGPLRTTRPANYALRRENLERYIALKREQTAAAAAPKRDAAGAWYWNPVDALAEATQQLATLPPAAAARPACYAEYTASPASDGRYQLRGRILPVDGSTECRPLVTHHWDYFDLTLPRSAVQLVVLQDFGRCTKLVNGRLTSWWDGREPVDLPMQGCGRHVRMWRDADWSRVLALLAP